MRLGAESYDVTVTEQTRGGKSFVVTSNDTSAFVANIQSGTLYQIHVTSVTRENIKSTGVTSLLARTSGLGGFIVEKMYGLTELLK